MGIPQILALDGHDGVGKTTLATLLAQRVGACYVRPFSGERGAALMRVAASDNPDEVLRVGAKAIVDAVSEADDSDKLVLDRGWLTVSTLVSAEYFSSTWGLWFPTVLLWCDLPTTLTRLSMRDEKAERVDWHERYLTLYQSRSKLGPSEMLRTDLTSQEECLERLFDIYTLSAKSVNSLKP